jgi:hypothetical protein
MPQITYAANATAQNLKTAITAATTKFTECEAVVNALGLTPTVEIWSTTTKLATLTLGAFTVGSQNPRLVNHGTISAYTFIVGGTAIECRYFNGATELFRCDATFTGTIKAGCVPTFSTFPELISTVAKPAGSSTVLASVFTGSGTALNRSFNWATAASSNALRQHVVSFKQGEVISGQFVAAFDGATQLASQCKVWNRWPDGSIKQCVVAYVIPALPVIAANTYARGAIPAGAKVISYASVATDPSGTPATRASVVTALASMTVAVSGTEGSYSWNLATLLNAATYADTDILSNTPMLMGRVHAGALVTSYVLADHAGVTMDATSTNGVKLRPIFEIKHYPTLSKTCVRVTLEISNSAALGDWLYNLAVSGPVTWSATGLDQRSGQFITREFWIGGDPDANQDRFFTDPWEKWADAGSTLNYPYPNTCPEVALNQAIGATNMGYAALQAINPLTLVLSDGYNGATGGRFELGPEDFWGLQGSQSGDPRIRQYAERRAEGYHMGQAIRESQNPITDAGYKRFYADQARTIAAKGYPITQIARASWRGSDGGNGPFNLSVVLAAEQSAPVFQRGPAQSPTAYSWADRQHTYQLYNRQFLQTGDWSWCERAMCLGAFLSAGANNYRYDDTATPAGALNSASPVSFGAGVNAEMIPSAAIRGPAWSGMTMANAFSVLPDGHVMKSTFREFLVDNLCLVSASLDIGTSADWTASGRSAMFTWAQNIQGSWGAYTYRTPIQWLNTQWTTKGFKPVGFMAPGRLDLVPEAGVTPLLNTDGTNRAQMDHWEHAFYSHACARLYELGFANALPLLTYSSKIIDAFGAMANGWEASTNYHYTIEDTSRQFWQTPAAFRNGGLTVPTTGTYFQNAPNTSWADKDYSYLTSAWANVEYRVQVTGNTALRTSFRSFLAAEKAPTYDYSDAFKFSGKFMTSARA